MENSNLMTEEQMKQLLSGESESDFHEIPSTPIGPQDTRNELERLLGRRLDRVGTEFVDESGVKRVVASPPEAQEQKVVEQKRRRGRPLTYFTVSARERLLREANPVLFDRALSDPRHFRKPVNAKLPEGTDPILCDDPECRSPELYFIDPTSTRYRNVQTRYMAVGKIHLRLALCKQCHKLHVIVYV